MVIKEYPIAEIDEDGDRVWYLPSKGPYHYHNENGPAIISRNGFKSWWIDGEQHREDGPAIIDSSGSKWWFKNGKKHRTDGPAVEWAGGSKEWYINGKELPSTEVERWLKENNIDLTTEEGQMALILRWS